MKLGYYTHLILTDAKIYMTSVFNYFCLFIINNFKALKIKEIWVTLQVSAAIAQ